MPVTYAKLRQLKIDLGFNWRDIVDEGICSNGVISNINKDKYIKLDSIESIAEYLNKRYDLNLDIGDLVSIKK